MIREYRKWKISSQNVAQNLATLDIVPILGGTVGRAIAGFFIACNFEDDKYWQEMAKTGQFWPILDRDWQQPSKTVNLTGQNWPKQPKMTRTFQWPAGQFPTRPLCFFMIMQRLFWSSIYSITLREEPIT
jgi:hypothetical protein